MANKLSMQRFYLHAKQSDLRSNLNANQLRMLFRFGIPLIMHREHKVQTKLQWSITKAATNTNSKTKLNNDLKSMQNMAT